MRALSVRQPWAELIASGRKKVENRTWKVDFRGDLLIVASASRQDDDCADEGLDPDALTYGAAVCIVDLWKVTGDIGSYKWHVRDPRRVEPVRLKGYAAIYNVDDALLRPLRGKQPVSVQRERPKPVEPAVRLAGKPSVLVAVRDERMVRRWERALSAVGCRVVALRDGYSAWQHLQARPAACVLLDAEIDGYSAGDVLSRMRASAGHATTPIVSVGKLDSHDGSRIPSVGRTASADAVVKAVRKAVLAGGA